MICHHITGKCLDCKTGYYGETCEACPPKFYGTHCMKLCSTRCLNESCNAATGRCDKCNPGYKGRFCNEECPIGMFGQDCKNECSDYCRGGKTQCNKVDGACRKGCLNNLLPPDCMKKFKKNKKELEPSNIGDDLIRYALMFAALLIVIAIVERYQLSETQRKTRKGNESAVQGRTAQLNALWAEQEYPFLMPSEDEEQNDLLPPSSSSSAASSKGTFSAGELQKMMDPGEKAAAIPISASSISKGGRRSRHSSLLKNNVGVKADIVKKVTSKLDSVKP